MNQYYSITPIANFKSSRTKEDISFCTFEKMTGDALKKIFRNDYKAPDFSYRVGAMFPTEQEIEIMRDCYFLCFSSETFHNRHFASVLWTLRLLDSYPSIAARTYTSEPKADGYFENWERYSKLPALREVPDIIIPEDARVSDEAKRLWWQNRYRRLSWDSKIEKEFIELEDKFRKFIEAEDKKQYKSYLWVAFKLLFDAQKQPYRELRVIQSCLVLELLCLRPNSGRGIGGKLGRAVHVLLPGNIGDKRDAEKAIQKYYKKRSDIVHGIEFDSEFKKDKTNITISQFDVEYAFDITRRIILFMLEKSINEGLSKRQILEQAGV